MFISFPAAVARAFLVVFLIGFLLRLRLLCSEKASGFSLNRDCTGHLDALRWRAGIGFRDITVLARLTLQVKAVARGGQNARF